MKITRDQVINIGNALSIDWKKYEFREFLLGMNEEFEHMGVVKHGDPSTAIASTVIEHLNENPHYYSEMVESFPNLGESTLHDLHHSKLEENLAARAYRERAVQARASGNFKAAKKFEEIATEEDEHEIEFGELLE